MDADGRISSANQAALALVNKNLAEVSNELGGNVMGCKYAFQPEGCGETVHCAACTIRNNVIRTDETGESLHEVPARLLIKDEGGEADLRLFISTEKKGDVVLLRIDKVFQ